MTEWGFGLDNVGHDEELWRLVLTKQNSTLNIDNIWQKLDFK